MMETIDRLPGPVREQSGPVVEAEMATAATKVTPADLEVLARDVMVRADPDGTLRDIDHAHEQRGLRLRKKRGRAGYTLNADLDQETDEAARVVLDAWSKPAPAAPNPIGGDAEQDSADQPQTAGQSRGPGDRWWSRPAPGRPPAPRADARRVRRRPQAVLNSGDLPACGGTPAAIIWHIDDQVLRERYGLAISEHGTLLPVGDALRDGRPGRAVPADRERQGGPALPRPDHADRHPRPNRRPRRPGPRLLLPRLRPATHRTANDTTSTTGCHDGPTDIDNLTLLCGYHHRELAKRGWTCHMLDGLPHWRPPAWLDPTQTPIRNTRHFTLPDHPPTSRAG